MKKAGDFVKEIFRRDSRVLLDASDELQPKRESARETVKQNDLSLEGASFNLRNHRKLVMKAV